MGAGGRMAKRVIRRMLLIRSGPTEWDRSGRLQGQTDLPMLPEAASALAERLATVTVEGMTGLVSSPDEASMTTADLMGERAGVRVQAVDELRELDLGLWAGLRVEELEERFERAGRQWLEDPAAVSAPQGETLSAMAERVLPALERAIVKKRSSVGVAVVVRPIVHAYLRCRLEQLETTEMWRICSEQPSPAWYELNPNDSRLSVAAGLADRRVPAA